MIDRKVFRNYEDWYNYRKSNYFIGGHDIAVITGHDEYKTPLDWYNDYQRGQARKMKLIIIPKGGKQWKML